MPTPPTHVELANALRMLAVDAVQEAGSGHPGMPMGMADIAEALWRHRLRHNPSNPAWCDRDRFVLSNGHGSMLQYALLHLSGYDLPIDELRRFRQVGSRTAGHPERGLTPGVEVTTGPLGQGLANAVGMALAERLLAAEFNREGFPVVDHRTWVFLGDGCLMEGISQEAISLAGTWKLGRLAAFYDDNGFSIDVHIGGWFSDDTLARFEACGWRVIRAVDGHNAGALDAAIGAACATSDQPTLIVCKTVIGKGSPSKAGTHDCHGAPLGAAEVAATRAALGWAHAPFEVPDDVRAAWDAREEGARREAAWRALFERYRRAHPQAAAEFERRIAGELPVGFADHRPCEPRRGRREGRVDRQPEGQPEQDRRVRPCAAGARRRLGRPRGVEPHALAGSARREVICRRQLCLLRRARVRHGRDHEQHRGSGGLGVFGATFLMFSEYARNALRMAALMKLNPIYVFTHDSIGVGEDGPTHHPVKQTATLRLIPGMQVWRPCDAVETCVAWSEALASTRHPTSLILSRQTLQHQARSATQLDAIPRGGYVLREPDEPPRAVLLATGSEVALAVEAAQALAAQGIPVRVVSMPSTGRFDAQDASWREAVLPRGVPRLAIEAGVTDVWPKYVGLEGDVVGIDTFGESAPAGALFEHFGLTVPAIVARVRALLERTGRS